MSNILTLTQSGAGGCIPDQNPWTPESNQRVEIHNNSGFEQQLTNITNGVLAPAPQRSVTVPVGGWTGRSGSSRGTYTYDDGLPEAGPRTGTIDPS